MSDRVTPQMRNQPSYEVDDIVADEIERNLPADEHGLLAGVAHRRRAHSPALQDVDAPDRLHTGGLRKQAREGLLLVGP